MTGGGEVTSAGESSAADLSFPADARHLIEVRRTVERLARHIRLNQAELDDLLTAVDEAVANAIRHGSPLGTKNTVWVTCRVTGDTLVVSVRDEGRGFYLPSDPEMPRPEAVGGRGLPLMCALSDTVEIARHNGGTRVTLQKRACTA